MRTVREQIELSLEGAWFTVALVTIWPRSARLLNPFVGRPPRRVVRNVVLWTAWMVAAREWLGPRAQAAIARRERELAELAARLGHKPTNDEVVEDFVRRRAERKAARRRRARAERARRAAPGP